MLQAILWNHKLKDFSACHTLLQPPSPLGSHFCTSQENNGGCGGAMEVRFPGGGETTTTDRLP